MPCLTYEPKRNICDYVAEADRLKKQVAKLEAMLCGVITGVGEDLVLATYNEKESGVKLSVLNKWWLQHKLKDYARKSKRTIKCSV